MAWYKTGTVSVTNGATSITGAGTSFATNSRVGDGFRGPDGEWYEVTNIASETTLGIYPAYQGVTVSASANYMIAPLQGYNKESADRLRAISDSLTVVTSVAGRTGNVVLAKGDVGLSNVDNTSDANKPISTPQANGLQAKITDANKASVQTTLGLVPTQSTTDITVGRVLKSSDYGLGIAITVTDANVANTVNGGFFKLVSPFTNGPTASAYIIQSLVYDSEVTQIAYVEGGTLSVQYMRQYRGGWQQWVKTATARMAGDDPVGYSGSIDDTASVPFGYVTVTSSATGTKPPGKTFGFLQTFGQTPSSTSAIRQMWNDFDGAIGTKTTWVRDKYGTNGWGNWRLIFDQNSIVGTVTNPASGPSTSSAIEYGTNASGSYIRFIDGTQIAWVKVGTNSPGTYAIGSLFGSDAYSPGSGSYPASFVAQPNISASCTRGSSAAGVWAVCYTPSTATSWGSWRILSVDSTAVAGVIHLTAVGRWF